MRIIEPFVFIFLMVAASCAQTSDSGVDQRGLSSDYEISGTPEKHPDGREVRRLLSIGIYHKIKRMPADISRPLMVTYRILDPDGFVDIKFKWVSESSSWVMVAGDQSRLSRWVQDRELNKFDNSQSEQIEVHPVFLITTIKKAPSVAELRKALGGIDDDIEIKLDGGPFFYGEGHGMQGTVAYKFSSSSGDSTSIKLKGKVKSRTEPKAMLWEFERFEHSYLEDWLAGQREKKDGI